MYCYNCGTEIGEGKAFCPACGISQAPETDITPEADFAPDVTVTPIMEYETYNIPVKQSKKLPKWIWITVASIVAVSLAACAIYFIFFQNISHLMTVGRALNNLAAEIEERTNNSPFKALVMLPEIMEDGTITANVEYSHDLLADWFGPELGAQVQLSSNTETREFALNLKETYSSGFNEIDLYMNRERLALRLGLLDNNYYGIKYDTFRDDIRVFGRLLFLDNETMDSMADIVDLINEIINLEEQDDLQQLYLEAFKKFAGSLKTSSSRTTFEAAGEGVRCTAIEISITKENILELINDIYEIYTTSESFQEQSAILDNPLFNALPGRNGNSFYEEYLKNAKDYIDIFEQTYEGDIKVTFYISNDDRLLCITLNADTIYEGENSKFYASLFLGNSIEDDWTFLLMADDVSVAAPIIWSYKNQSGNHINTIDATIDSVTIQLKSQWEESSGRFNLSYDDGWLSGAGITGTFTSDDKSFRLAFDNLFSGQTDGKLIIDLTAEQGADINTIEFINIDKWGQTLINSILRLLFGLIF